MAYQYKKIKLKNGRTIDQHRQIMQAHLGRTLLRNEVVHHKDGDKLNNSLDNLEVMSLSEHSRMHMKNRPVTPETRAKLFLVGIKARERTSKLKPEGVAVIKRRIANGEHFDAIAKDYGVSHRTIRGIAKNWAWRDVAMAA